MISITVNNVVLNSKQSMNILGVQFDSKLSWCEQINKTINKAKKTLHAINLIKKYFTQSELKGLLTSNYFSILYYNSEIWHLQSLGPHLKQKLLAASANALKLCTSPLPQNTSYNAIHSLAKRGTPDQMSDYKLAIQLFKLYNSDKNSNDWIDLNFQQMFNARQEHFSVCNTSRYKVGRNLIVNRLHSLNNKISYDCLNKSFEAFKITCKNLFLH